MLIIGAIIELVLSKEKMVNTLVPEALQRLQKSIKYGLPTVEAIQLFEKGFSDRIVATAISNIFIQEKRIVSAKNIIGLNKEVRQALGKFPWYFTYQMDSLSNTNMANEAPE